jgi:endonuclease/exonuclease/phosphatase family metal-dependent hydrolase
MLVFLLGSLLPAGAAPRRITILCYNVENLFDDVDNGGEYPDYRLAAGGWSRELFRLKVSRIAEVIRRAAPGGPDIVALQEVENRSALLGLRELGLKGMGYREAVLIAGDGASCPAGPPATHPAVLSRWPVRRTGLHQVVPCADGAAAARSGEAAAAGAQDVRRAAASRDGQAAAGETAVRGILEVELEVEGRTLYLFNNHWKSRTGGARRTEPLRLAAARVLAARIRSILDRDPRADIVVLGDLNESVEESRGADGADGYPTALAVGGEAAGDVQKPSPQTAHASASRAAQRSGASAKQNRAEQESRPVLQDAALFLTADPALAGRRGERLMLYEPWYELPRPGWGSYAFGGTWQTLDHILLSAGLFDRRGLAYRAGGFRVLREPFLLEPKTGFPRRWNGYRTQKGISDHLPLLLGLELGDEE